MCGGSLQVHDIKDFIKASYAQTPPSEINGWWLDTDLSSPYAKVYYKPFPVGQSGDDYAVSATITHMGTKGLSDWGNNLIYGLSGETGYKQTQRFKQAQELQNKTEKKYGSQNVSTLGHSQSGLISQLVGKNSKEVITLNPMTSLQRGTMTATTDPNIFNIRSSADVASVFNIGKTQNKNNIVIPVKSWNLYKEHKSDVLDNLDPNMVIGR